MIERTTCVFALCCLAWLGCSNGSGGSGSGGASGTGGGGTSLAGTWDLTTTEMGSSPVKTTLVVGQDTLTVKSPSFSFTATRSGNARTFTDEQNLGSPSDNVVVSATQTPGSFNAGIIPFDLSGSWTMTFVPAGGPTVETCNVTVSSSEIDCTCKETGSAGFDFNFTTKKMSSATSSFGDFGGKWLNTWVWPGKGGGTYPCELDFTGNSIQTCAGGGVGGEVKGSPLAGITFTFDGANTASGAAKGWAEYSATRK